MKYSQFCPVAKAMEVLGDRWTLLIAREVLMLYLERSIVREHLPGPQLVLQFEFTDLKTLRNWWLLADAAHVEVCEKDPGQDIDLYFTSTVKTMSDVWMGHRTYRDAMREGDLTIIGEAGLTRSMSRWLSPSTFAQAAA